MAWVPPEAKKQQKNSRASWSPPEAKKQTVTVSQAPVGEPVYSGELLTQPLMAPVDVDIKPPKPDYTGKGRGLFGLPQSAEKAIFPEASEVAGPGSIGAKGRSVGSHLRQAGTGAFDGIGLPLRSIMSLHTLIPGGESYTEALGRTGGREDSPGVIKFVEDIARDPLTSLLAIATGGAGAARQPVQKGAKKGQQKAGQFLE